MASEADRIFARGREITIGRGPHRHVLRFDLESFAELEDIYGDGALVRFAQDIDRRRWRALWVGLVVGQAHEGLPIGIRRERVRSWSAEVVTRAGELWEAVSAAFVESLPAPEPEDSSPNADGEQGGSPGPATTASPSVSESPSASSGA